MISNGTANMFSNGTAKEKAYMSIKNGLSLYDGMKAYGVDPDTIQAVNFEIARQVLLDTWDTTDWFDLLATLRYSEDDEEIDNTSHLIKTAFRTSTGMCNGHGYMKIIA